MTQTSRQKKTMIGCERKREKKCCFKFFFFFTVAGVCMCVDNRALFSNFNYRMSSTLQAQNSFPSVLYSFLAPLLDCPESSLFFSYLILLLPFCLCCIFPQSKQLFSLPALLFMSVKLSTATLSQTN